MHWIDQWHQSGLIRQVRAVPRLILELQHWRRESRAIVWVRIRIQMQAILPYSHSMGTVPPRQTIQYVPSTYC